MGGTVITGTAPPSAGSLGFPVRDFLVARLNPDGTPDLTFGTGGVVSFGFETTSSGPMDDILTAVAVQPDGKIVLAGSTQVPPPVSFDVRATPPLRFGSFAAARLNPDGTPDPGFGAGGLVRVPFDLGGNNSDTVLAVGLRADGTVVLAGTADATTLPLVLHAGDSIPYADAVARPLPNGALDPSFGTAGKAEADDTISTGGAQVAAVLPDGGAVFAGNVDVVRLTAAGQLDPAFGTGGRAPTPFFLGTTQPTGINWASPPQAVAVQSDGRILLGGSEGGHGVLARLLGAATPTAPTVVIPGSVLAGGAADGSAKLLLPTAAPYQVGEAVAFWPGFTGAVRTAVADVTGDGVPDLIAGAGPGGRPGVVVLDGKTRAVVANFLAFEDSFTGGVYVAAADLDGDGKADLVVTPDRGGGPVAAVYDGAKLTAGAGGDAAQVVRFFGIEDPNFRGGARPALGDLNGDKTPDLAVAAGFLGGPRVAVFDGKSVAAGNGSPGRLVPDFFAFEPGLRNGAFVTAGDTDGDGFADLAVGAGPGGAPRVRVFSGKGLLAAGGFASLDDVPAAQLADFFAFDPSLRGGVRVAWADPDGNGRADLVSGSGEGEPSRVRVFRAEHLHGGVSTPDPDQELDPFGAVLAGGVFVG